MIKQILLKVVWLLALANPVTSFLLPADVSFCSSNFLTSVKENQSPITMMADRREFTQTTLGGALALGLASSTSLVASTINPSPVSADIGKKTWAPLPNIPTGVILFDIDFDSKDLNHGYIVGSKGTFLETKDGGNTWEPRSFVDLDPDEEVTYRFEKVTFKDGEGWVLGKPSILLHTSDNGKSWERIPLSPKLPGEPSYIFALGDGKAEMTTTTGAVYRTNNSGRNWKAQVKETIDATLNRISSSGVKGASYYTGSIINVQRAEEGSYLAVSSRGNFFLTWTPGEDFWVPHNRGTSRRIQNMGFVQDGTDKIWITLNGGVLQTTDKKVDFSLDEFPFTDKKIRTGGYGIIDVAWKDEQEVWAVGGGGTMYVSRDGGKSFTFNKSADDIPGNLYKVKFFANGNGFVLGSDGILLKYQG